MKVSDMIRALQKCDPNALVLWSATGAAVADAIVGAVKPAKVSPINEHHFSVMGPGRTIEAVLIDTAA